MDADEYLARARAGVDPTRLSVKGDGGGVTLRDRFRRTMQFQSVDRIPNFEFGYWDETLPEWHKQGLPPEIVDEATAYAYFGIEEIAIAPIDVMGLIPPFDDDTIEEDDDYRTYRDPQSGCIARINKEGPKSIPHYIEFYLKDRASWEQFRERLRPDAKRLPANWPDLAAAYNRRDYPLAVPIGSLIGLLRNFIGFERTALMIYDDPELLEEMADTLCDLICTTLEPVLADVEFDGGHGWEDICFNSGPIVGVDFMEQVIAPRYKRITDLLAKHGCHFAWIDCDGNILPIIDAFHAGGINCMFPVEVHGGSDPILMRQKHPGILMLGGVCKVKLLQGRDAIRNELERLLPLVKEGGFIPHVDHRVPMNMPLDDYKYYLKVKRDLFGAGALSPQYDEDKVG